jgi:hypothetical protein
VVASVLGLGGDVDVDAVTHPPILPSDAPRRT